MTQKDLWRHERLTAKAGSVSQLLDGVLDKRQGGSWPISLALTTLALRRQAPRCDISDRELAELVAIRAVERGHNVMFDADLLDEA